MKTLGQLAALSIDEVDETQTRVDKNFLELTWRRPEHKAIINFILNNNVIFILHHDTDKKLRKNRGKIGFPIPKTVLNELISKNREFIFYFESNEFYYDFWAIIYDLSFTNIFGNDEVTRYFVVDTLNEIRPNVFETTNLTNPLVALVPKDQKYQYVQHLMHTSRVRFGEPYISRDEYIELAPNDIKVMRDIARYGYTNFVNFFRILPLRYKQILWVLLNKGIYPEFLMEKPFELEIFEKKGVKSIRMSNKGKSFATIVDMPEQSMLNKIKPSLARDLIEH